MFQRTNTPRCDIKLIYSNFWNTRLMTTWPSGLRRSTQAEASPFHYGALSTSNISGCEGSNPSVVSIFEPIFGFKYFRKIKGSLSTRHNLKKSQNWLQGAEFQNFKHIYYQSPGSRTNVTNLVVGVIIIINHISISRRSLHAEVSPCA
jgi:hypothetical protein